MKKVEGKREPSLRSAELSAADWCEVLHALAWVNQEYDMVPDEKRIRTALQVQLHLTDVEVWGKR